MYDFLKIEKKWQGYWSSNHCFHVEEEDTKPKYYILEMFPYPSGAGLHVGHPLGYIAGDIYARYKRMKGFNVLHPMGFDAFGLPAEQYAIQTNKHPEKTTSENIQRYKVQLKRIGLSYDWSREIQTSDPEYYRWTQWIFIQCFHSWYDPERNAARPIETLIEKFKVNGCQREESFTAEEWNNFTEKKQQIILLNYRLAYLGKTYVNWCSGLGTVLANNEIQNGFSIRGGFPVIQREMTQWFLRISAYAQRLLDGLDRLEWSSSLKEIQRQWIGRSAGVIITFSVDGKEDLSFKIFTTRPDTLFGVTFMVLAPENKLVDQLTTEEYRNDIEKYQRYLEQRSSKVRLQTSKMITGQFTGSYCIHPLTSKLIPIWISEYCLEGYGTSSIMGVPACDDRDGAFAEKFHIDRIEILSKDGRFINSEFLDGLLEIDGIEKMIDKLVDIGKGQRKINYRLRDAIFSRQRYWGEPFPIYFKDEMPYTLDLEELPLVLPEIDEYLPTEAGEPPLGRAQNWKSKEGHPLELMTMPGYAGSSAYYLRYMDAKNKERLISFKNNHYWKNVDLYIGGSEHARGHLIYARFFNKFLFDREFVSMEEPFEKLINQGMIQGRSQFVYRIQGKDIFVSFNLKDKYTVQEIHVDIDLVKNDILDIQKFKEWRTEYRNSNFILEDQKYITGSRVEKMSKSLFNIVNPDTIVDRYGADTFRLYEMFLGPIEQSKPWNTSSIEGVFRFLKKIWKHCFDDNDQLKLIDKKATEDELKIIHTSIKNVQESIETFSYNTAVSALMICLNDLGEIKSSNLSVMDQFIRLLAPFAPHIAEEIYECLGHSRTLTWSVFPEYDPSLLIETHYRYPVSINGKVKYLKKLSLSLDREKLEIVIMKDPRMLELIEDKKVIKIIIIVRKVINIVVR